MFLLDNEYQLWGETFLSDLIKVCLDDFLVSAAIDLDAMRCSYISISMSIYSGNDNEDAWTNSVLWFGITRYCMFVDLVFIIISDFSIYCKRYIIIKHND